MLVFSSYRRLYSAFTQPLLSLYSAFTQPLFSLFYCLNFYTFFDSRDRTVDGHDTSDTSTAEGINQLTELNHIFNH